MFLNAEIRFTNVVWHEFPEFENGILPIFPFIFLSLYAVIDKRKLKQ